MSNVVIILNTIILLVIVIYLITTRESGTPPQTDDSISTKSEAMAETESDDPETETETETEPEDPGTCEITGTWAMVGTCNADGTAKYTQTYKESKPGACPSSVKADFKVCCYQKGDWKDITECKPTGKKTQEQTTINCAENFKTREVECEYVGPWNKVGACSADGKQYYTRDVVNSKEPTSKSEGCCYISPWSGWGGWTACNGTNRQRNRTRIVRNCENHITNSEIQVQDCNHCSGYWTGWSGEKQVGSRWCSGPCGRTTAKFENKRTYKITKNAKNGGTACPKTNNYVETKVTYGTYGTCTGGGDCGK
jgi:hypothetical protein